MRKLLLAFLLFPALGHAITNVPGGVEIDVSYSEPNQNADGTPLKDLLRTTVYYSTSNVALSTATYTKAFDAPATAITGNGLITKTIVIPFPQGKESNVTFFAVAVDTNNLISAHSNSVVVRFDTLNPGAPKTLTISGNMLFYNYREPFLNSDGITPITDLASTNIYYNDSVSAALRLLGTFPATSPAGGGNQIVSFPLTTFIKGSTVRIYARFVDTSNNQSAFPQAVGIKIPN